MNFFKTSILLAGLTAVFMVIGFLLGGGTGMIIALCFAIGTNIFAFWKSGDIALHMHNAQAVTSRSHPELFRSTLELSQNAGLPMPQLYLIPSGQPNAFATGRSPENSAVAVTEGLLRLLNHDELEGVIAHELAHIKNRDTLTMTVAAIISGAISMLAQYGFFFRDRRQSAGQSALALLAVIVAPIAAMIVQMAISRTREYSADRDGALICKNPLALASALKKISQGAQHMEMTSAEKNPASAHLFIINPLSGRSFDALFATHPNVENRINALLDMAKKSGHSLHLRDKPLSSSLPHITRRRNS